MNFDISPSYAVSSSRRSRRVRRRASAHINIVFRSYRAAHAAISWLPAPNCTSSATRRLGFRIITDAAVVVVDASMWACIWCTVTRSEHTCAKPAVRANRACTVPVRRYARAAALLIDGRYSIWELYSNAFDWGLERPAVVMCRGGQFAMTSNGSLIIGCGFF